MSAPNAAMLTVNFPWPVGLGQIRGPERKGDSRPADSKGRGHRGGVKQAPPCGKKTFQVWREAAKVGAYDEMPMLPDDKQVQVHLSRNDRPQPFYLICGKDTLLSLMSGAAKVEFKGTGNRLLRTHSRELCLRAGRRAAPHRSAETSIMIRYKQMHAGLEGVAWYCDSCDAEIFREVWDTETTMSQLKYEEVSSRFLADASLRQCRQCGSDPSGTRFAGLSLVRGGRSDRRQYTGS